jgi:hypothetical protein
VIWFGQSVDLDPLKLSLKKMQETLVGEKDLKLKNEQQWWSKA